VDDNNWLLAQAGGVFLMMIVLALAKHKTRKSGLNRFLRRHSTRQQLLRMQALEFERERQRDTDNSVGNDASTEGSKDEND
jgi:hypothetical protein